LDDGRIGNANKEASLLLNASSGTKEEEIPTDALQ